MAHPARRCSLRPSTSALLGTLAVGSALLAPTGLHAEPAPAPAPVAQPAKPAPAKSAPPTVKLIKPGDEPRFTFRLTPKPADALQVEMSMVMTQSMTMGDQKSPSMTSPQITMPIQANVTDIAADGRVTFKYTYLAPKIDLTNDPLGAGARMKQSIDSLAGSTGVVVATPRGFIESAEFNLSGNDPMLAQMVDSLQQAMRQMSTPFPEEAIGKGGVWEVTVQSQLSGLDTTTVYTLTADLVTADQIDATVAIRQTAPAQDFKDPAAPPGMKLVSFLNEGSGPVVLRRDRVLPLRSRMVSNARIEFIVPTPEGNQTLVQNMQMTMAMNDVPVSKPATSEQPAPKPDQPAAPAPTPAPAPAPQPK